MNLNYGDVSIVLSVISIGILILTNHIHTRKIKPKY